MADSQGSAISSEEETELLEKSLEKIGSTGYWIYFLFVLAFSPGIFNALHIMSSVFQAHKPPHWCKIDELVTAKWTNDQITKISSPAKDKENKHWCSYYKWNYTHLVELGYEKAVNYTDKQPKPSLVGCKKYSYDEPVPKSTVVTEWDLVCDHAAQSSNAQASIATGKFIGGVVFGFVADKYGRKLSFIICCVLYIVAGPAAALANSYLLFLGLRFVIGLAGSGVYETAYTILMEIALKRRRVILCNCYQMSYPCGYILLATFAICFKSWRSIQYAISLPALLLLINIWFLPESPRWLITEGRRQDAWKIVRRVDKSLLPSEDFRGTDVKVEQVTGSFIHRFSEGILKLLSLFKSAELRNRILIVYVLWFVASLSYYVIALNATNVHADRIVYMYLNGILEIPSYIVPLIILMYIGRKPTGIVLYLLAGLCLLSIICVPKAHNTVILVLVQLGRFGVSAVFSVVILHGSELFPTSTRNTAIGTSLTMAQLGSILAPFIVDMLGAIAWFIPSTICGTLAILSGLLILLLPETRDKPLMDTAEDLNKAEHQDRVSFKNCCSFR